MVCGIAARIPTHVCGYIYIILVVGFQELVCLTELPLSNGHAQTGTDHSVYILRCLARSDGQRSDCCRAEPGE